MSLPDHYRYDSQHQSSGWADDGDYPSGHRFTICRTQARTFAAVKETPCGYWVQERPIYGSTPLKWVSKTSRKRYAFPTKTEALESYLARKTKQAEYAKANLERAMSELREAESFIVNTGATK